ncbi:MAG TPA: type II toxin-antitoxin system PemK/MazF family toxin [Candidatus Kaiserbacteria bacterium]|nr:type II toxin-antitoxin system PemK/MazF family toxin [Candidatus Kaiserbacteria bacterium]
MKKDFDKWNKTKKVVNDYGLQKKYNTRDVWWCSLGINIGLEQDGTGDEYQRPVVVIKGLSKDTCLIVPLTTSPKEHSMRIPVGEVEGKNASAIISQIRVVDTRRFVNKIDRIKIQYYEDIRKAVRGIV